MGKSLAVTLGALGTVVGAAVPRSGRAAIAASAAAGLWLVASSLAVLSLGALQWAEAPLATLFVAAAVVAPAWVFARFTYRKTHLRARNAMHALSYGLLVGWDLPRLVVRYGDGSMSAWSGHPAWVQSLVLQLFCIPAVFGLSALTEYTTRGRGSPMPLDPPHRLVTTGPFAYVANPMQLAKVLTLFAWALFARSWWLLIAAVVWLVLGAALLEPAERPSLQRRFGSAWSTYRRATRPWWPRWRPWRDPSRAAATVRFAGGCGPCRELAEWFASQRPVGLQIDSGPARTPRQIEYTDGDVHVVGVRALARSIEHINLAWALFAWCVRLPGIIWVAQIIYAASIRAPQQPAQPGP